MDNYNYIPTNNSGCGGYAYKPNNRATYRGAGQWRLASYDELVQLRSRLQ